MSLSEGNPRIPEGINASEENPLKEFAQLALGVTASVGMLVVILSLAAQWLAPFVPFSGSTSFPGSTVRLLRVGPSFAPASRWDPFAPLSRFQPLSRFYRQAASGWSYVRARFWLGPVRALFQVPATRRSNEEGFQINRT